MAAEILDFEAAERVVADKLAPLRLQLHRPSARGVSTFLFDVVAGVTGVLRLEWYKKPGGQRSFGKLVELWVQELERFEAELVGRCPRALTEATGVRSNFVCVRLADPKKARDVELSTIGFRQFAGDAEGTESFADLLREVVRRLVIPSWMRATTVERIYSASPRAYEAMYEHHAVALLMVGRLEEARAAMLERYALDVASQQDRRDSLAVAAAVASRLGIKPWPPDVPSDSAE